MSNGTKTSGVLSALSLTVIDSFQGGLFTAGSHHLFCSVSMFLKVNYNDIQHEANRNINFLYVGNRKFSIQWPACDTEVSNDTANNLSFDPLGSG